MRSPRALAYFSLTGKKDFSDVPQVRSFQMRITASSESPEASATMRQPETGLP